VSPSEPALDPAAVAEAFGLGAPRGPLEPVPGGRSHRLWHLRTDGGRWAVKALNRSREPWWLAEHAAAVAVEDAALAAGVAMPRPVAPLRPAGPRLADLPAADGPTSVLVHAWVEGVPLAPLDVPDDVLEWVAATLATLHALPAGDGAPVSAPHPAQEWAQWLAEAPPDVPPAFVREVAGFLPDVEAAVAVVERASGQAGGDLAVVAGHRDVKPDNVLLTAASSVLVDWDGAGPDVGAWEVVRTALAFSRSARAGQRAGFVRVLGAYRGAGGAAVPPDPAVLAGVLRHQLAAAAWMLFRALGHRPVTVAERAAALPHVLELLAELRASSAAQGERLRWVAEAQRG